jgi:hypothetical protein
VLLAEVGVTAQSKVVDREFLLARARKLKEAQSSIVSVGRWIDAYEGFSLVEDKKGGRPK